MTLKMEGGLAGGLDKTQSEATYTRRKATPISWRCIYENDLIIKLDDANSRR